MSLKTGKTRTSRYVELSVFFCQVATKSLHDRPRLNWCFVCSLVKQYRHFRALKHGRTRGWQLASGYYPIFAASCAPGQCSICIERFRARIKVGSPPQAARSAGADWRMVNSASYFIAKTCNNFAVFLFTQRFTAIIFSLKNWSLLSIFHNPFLILFDN